MELRVKTWFFRLVTAVWSPFMVLTVASSTLLIGLYALAQGYGKPQPATQVACLFKQDGQISFTRPESDERIFASVFGTPCQNSVLHLRITRGSEVLYDYRAPFHPLTEGTLPPPASAGGIAYERALRQAANAALKEIVEAGMIGTTRQLPRLPPTAFDPQSDPQTRLTFRQYARLKRLEAPLFRHRITIPKPSLNTGSRTTLWRYVVFDALHRQGSVVLEHFE